MTHAEKERGAEELAETVGSAISSGAAWAYSHGGDLKVYGDAQVALTELHSRAAELVTLKDALRDAAEAEEHLTMKARSDADFEGAAIHSHAASVLREVIAAAAREALGREA